MKCLNCQNEIGNKNYCLNCGYKNQNKNKLSTSRMIHIFILSFFINSIISNIVLSVTALALGLNQSAFIGSILLWPFALLLSPFIPEMIKSINGYFLIGILIVIICFIIFYYLVYIYAKRGHKLRYLWILAIFSLFISAFISVAIENS